MVVRRDLCGELATAGDDAIVQAACDLLARYLGGSAQTYRETWGKVPG